MLYPQNNRARTVIDLSGVWDFRLTEDAPWEPLAVPGSYNDQKPDSRYREHCGLSWYRRRIALPAALHEGRQVLRFDAVTHNARIFLDGVLVGEHRGGFLPFDVDVTGRLLPGASATVASLPSDAAVIPLPSPDTTPPVTNMYFFIPAPPFLILFQYA